MYEQIETERLIIRPIKLNDKSFILDLLNTKSWLQFIGDRKIKDEKDAENYIQKIIDNRNFFTAFLKSKIPDSLSESSHFYIETITNTLILDLQCCRNLSREVTPLKQVKPI